MKFTANSSASQKHQKFQDLNPLEIFDFTFDARSQYTVK